MIGNRFAGVDADADIEALGGLDVVSGETTLDIGGGMDRVGNVVESGHDAVTSVFDFPAAMRV